MTLNSVVITGVGPISAIGSGREVFWESLKAGKHGFSRITRCDISRSPSKIGAEVKDFRVEDYLNHVRPIARRIPRPVQFAMAAAVLALRDSEIDLENCDRDRIGVYVGSSVANLGEAFEARDRWKASKDDVPPDSAFHLFNHSAACVLSSLFDLRGPIHTISSGCNSGLDALGQSFRLIQLGLIDAMLVVGTDCELVPEIMAVLNASASLTTRYNDDPGRASRPFDLDRDGVVVGEGAGAVLLESESHSRARKAKDYARIAGYSICSSGRNRKYDSRSPEMDLRPCVRAFRDTMKEANWNAKDIDLINANGSSSICYDRLEALALAEVMNSYFPEVRVHSIKSMLGQHGAGSSALQVISACLSLKHGIVPPTINHEKMDPACGPIRVVTRAESSSPKNILVHSIGLGGFSYSCGAFTAPS